MTFGGSGQQTTRCWKASYRRESSKRRRTYYNWEEQTSYYITKELAVNYNLSDSPYIEKRLADMAIRTSKKGNQKENSLTEHDKQETENDSDEEPSVTTVQSTDNVAGTNQILAMMLQMKQETAWDLREEARIGKQKTSDERKECFWTAFATAPPTDAVVKCLLITEGKAKRGGQSRVGQEGWSCCTDTGPGQMTASGRPGGTTASTGSHQTAGARPAQRTGPVGKRWEEACRREENLENGGEMSPCLGPGKRHIQTYQYDQPGRHRHLLPDIWTEHGHIRSRRAGLVDQTDTTAEWTEPQNGGPTSLWGSGQFQ